MGLTLFNRKFTKKKKIGDVVLLVSIQKCKFVSCDRIFKTLECILTSCQFDSLCGHLEITENVGQETIPKYLNSLPVLI